MPLTDTSTLSSERPWDLCMVVAQLSLRGLWLRVATGTGILACMRMCMCVCVHMCIKVNIQSSCNETVTYELALKFVHKTQPVRSDHIALHLLTKLHGLHCNRMACGH